MTNALIKILLIRLIMVVVVNNFELHLHCRNSHLSFQLLNRIILLHPISVYGQIYTIALWVSLSTIFQFTQWFVNITIIFRSFAILIGGSMCSEDFRTLWLILLQLIIILLRYTIIAFIGFLLTFLALLLNFILLSFLQIFKLLNLSQFFLFVFKIFLLFLLSNFL